MPLRVRPNVKWAPGAKKTSGPYRGGPPRGLLHATITPSTVLPGYQYQSMAPHETMLWYRTTKRLVPITHLYFDQYAKALVNKSGGVETNTESTLQWELAGYLAETTPKGQFDILTAPDIYWEQLADLIGPIVLSWGVKNKFSRSFTGRRNVRMSMSEWTVYDGMCTHADVPENSHWDLPLGAHVAKILSSKIWTPAPSKPFVNTDRNASPTYPLPSGHWYGVDDKTKYSHSGVKVADRDEIRKIQIGINKWLKSKAQPVIAVDGKYGPKTARAVTLWQRSVIKRLADHSADGKFGRNSWNVMF